ncbi:MAG TPA: malonate decarboxylase subunit alpha [Candidatus Intestinimonas merdavium]|uniref:Malonate decarboxylase subunit alpha n=1 Tax=Candidatus Intestinimonas merdavium TaxID=2838622 RepID=A0A9D1Z568_9FIRM|nr:malonate decarboxylase subunit alpha [Candidatus Intestinimonas merdavium]
MGKAKIISPQEAAALLRDGDTFTTSGFVASGIPETLNKAVERRFLETGHPRDLTYVYASSQGNRDGRGGEHYAHKGLLKRFIAGHWATVPALAAMAMRNELEGYNLAQGALCHLFRDIAAHKPGTITQVGLGTFVDPRNGGGKLNSVTTEDLVELLTIRGKEYLFYPTFPIHVALLRGTYADEKGNVTMEKEIATLEATSVAQAVKNSGGVVVVQVEEVVRSGSLDPRLVKIPGIYVDYVVVAPPEDHQQSLDCSCNCALSGGLRAPDGENTHLSLSAKKVIGRRGALELMPDAVVNLGVGAPEYVAAVAAEEGIGEQMTLTVESGPVGGIPQGGLQFGSTLNADAILDQPYQFDFYDGGGLDLAYLGLAQCDQHGNINVSRFGPKIAGCGGFIDISQNTPRVCFCGTFTADGLKVRVQDGAVHIDQEGRSKKFLRQVEQVTFSGDMAVQNGQQVIYITERCVFRLKPDGLHLTEIATGIDLQRDILDQMEFEPVIEYKDGAVPLMDLRIFQDAPMGLGRD